MGQDYGYTGGYYPPVPPEDLGPVKRSGAEYERNKKLVYAREICWLCGKPVRYDVGPRHPLAPSLDHRHPVIRGGTNHIDNCELAHYGCNSARHDSVVTSATRRRSRDYGSPEL
jgi:5-methylcytosine-specific restriction endonuclease McrA